MPLVQQAEPLGARRRLPAPDPDVPRPGFFTETLPAGFRLDNTIGATVSDERRPVARGPFGGAVIDPAFDPFEGLEGTEFEPHLPRFALANTEEERAAIKRQIERETADRATLAAAGAGGIVAGLIAGVLDPVNLIPVGGQAAFATRQGFNVLRTAGLTARAGFLSSTAAEAVLQASQATRLPEESAINIAGSTVLAGVLGGAVPVVVGAGRAAFGRLAARVEDEMQVPPEVAADPREPGFQPVTAAELRRDTRDAEVEAEIEGEVEAPEVPRARAAGAAATPLTEKIAGLVRRTRAGPGTVKDAIDLGTVAGDTATVINRAFREGGVTADVTGFRHTMDSFGVQHVLKRHTDPEVELSRGQVPITDTDFQRVPEILAAPEEIVMAGPPTARSGGVVRYRKAFDDGTIMYLEELRTGRRELALRTMFKVRARGGPGGGPGRSDAGRPTPDPNAQGDPGRPSNVGGRAPESKSPPPVAPGLLVRAERFVNDRDQPVNRETLGQALGADEALVDRVLNLLVARGLLRASKGGGFRRTPRRGPLDLLQFLAAHGGIRDEAGELKARDAQRFVPGFGALVRKTGMSLDDAGERLHEAGFFGPAARVARPDVNGVLALLDEALRGRKVFSETDRAEVEALATRRQTEAVQGPLREAVADVEAAAAGAGLRATKAEVSEAAELMLVQGLDADEALVEVLERQALRLDEELSDVDDAAARDAGESPPFEGARGAGEREGGGRAPGGEPGADQPAAGPPGRGPGRRSLDSEATDQGEQFLIGGIRPVTDRARVEAGLDRPLQGDDAPLDIGLFDAGARRQLDIDDVSRGDLPELDDVPEPPEGASDAGAAQAGPTLAEEGLKSAFGLEKAIAFQDPMLRAATSPSISARRVMQELAETPLVYEKNALGVASPVAVESRIKLWQAPLAEAMTDTDEAFVRYRLGRAKRLGDIPRLGAQDLAGQVLGGRPTRLTYTQFKQEVGRAMRRDDSHDIPEVAEAARSWRAKIFEPLKERAIEDGLMAEDVGVETAASYLMRLYDIERVAARRPEFTDIIAAWMARRQATRAAIQRDLAALVEDLRETGRRERSTERRLATQSRREQRAEAQLDENQRLLGREIERSMELKERATDERGRAGQETRQRSAAAQRREVSTVITALRERVNTLHDRRQGAAAARDDLSEALARIQAKHAATVDDIDELLALWPARNQPETARAALRQLTDLDDAELRDQAAQIVDRILGTPDGRLPYDATADSPRGGGGSGGRGQRPQPGRPLRARTFLIDDALIEDFLESDIEVIGRIYTRTMAADVELARRFGSVDLVEQIDAIRADYARKARAAANDPGGDKARLRLQRRRDGDIRDVAAVRDRLRGTYALPRDPASLVVRGGRVVRSLNYLRLLGGMTISAIPDAARTVMVHGLGRTFGDGLVPLVTQFRTFRLAGKEVQLAGTGLDLVLDTRTMAIADVMDDFGRFSKPERAVKALSDRFGLVSLMAPWNAAMKQFSGVVTMSRILDASDAVVAGRITPKELEKLAAGGIDAEMAKRIAQQFASHGEVSGRLKLANTGRWDDRAAAEVFRTAVAKEVDKIIVTPGQDRPLWMSTELGKMVGQFRSFSMASSQRMLLAGLQQRDLAVLNGSLMAVGLGMLVYAIKTWQAGRELSDDPGVWLAEGIDRSGMTGWFMDVNNIAEKVSRGRVGVSALTGGPTISRYASRNVTGAIFGPSVGLIEDFSRVTGSAFAGDFRPSDTRALRRLLPYQNLFYMRQILDAAEAGVNRELGVQ